MAAVLDVATFILHEHGPMTAMKLQKLVYYSQSWHLVWEDCELFPERIEAWANGPVVPDLYREHRRQFRLSESDISGNPAMLDKPEKSTVMAVLKYYGKLSAQQLSDLTHSEEPWKGAREGYGPGERSYDIIPLSAMAEYYGSL
ncbi:Panacea domain-containing protein [Propionicimonas sp.]|uniref:Panacea domain-containing protein n=1 Tax=Propionicimonas sp. TaxID=1955623 RepID=UPI0017A959C6|nr:type II toxin-antitoxin system antitoxin SocA domain-containing protein [Propionicimonas sp.]MBU3977343.1 DUF4065 domain-containing protein [Actinomycetota bacterium]MBA3021267.1 DUF4065 domain-containing protein [Propionicimonas sp.]MBU3985853.1 DUF4065 domain-containing protein [Actinomycetota bacterium]MBU4008638.1 DUF4065 domain-containing protein [Actinomycetota bacterium]MBU4066212.1 DUF4065 domain-containing protein [Actinomycetota bacterium]